MSTATKWLGPVSGLAAMAAVIVGQGISGNIDSEPSDSSSAILAELRAEADDMRLGVIFGVLAIGLLLIYIGHLRTTFHEKDAAWAGNVFAAGGVALVSALLIFVAAEVTGAEAGRQGHAEVAQGVIDFNWNGAWLFSPGLLAAGVGVAVASFSSQVLPRWLGGFGVLVAVSAIAPWVGVPIFALWVIAASIHELVSLVQDRHGTEETAPGAA